MSNTEVGLLQLVDSFKSDYREAKTSSLRDSTINKYNLKFFTFLSSNNLDSFKVHVDTVMKEGSKVTTKFHYHNDIAFQYGLTFTKPTTKFFDSLFQFMTGLKAGTDTIVNFSYMGSHRLNYSVDTSIPTLAIFAIPTFLKKK